MFIGRDVELELLSRPMREIAAPCTLAVVGPAGIGKTSLCGALAERARVAGFRVAWGRTWEFGGTPPYFPWSRVFSTLGVQALTAELEEGSEAADARARLRLFEAARRALVEAARETPVLVVIDDLHAADLGSIQLLRYLQRELGEARVALLFACRDVEQEAGSTVKELVQDVTRDATRRLRLGGLTEAAIAEWLPWFCGQQVPDGLAARLVELTGGNPFFTRELVVAQHADLGAIGRTRQLLPEGVREVLRRQIAVLPNATQQALQAASVFGRGVELGVLAALLGCSVTAVLEDLRAGVEARLIEPTDASGDLTFTHALVSEALYAELAPARRLALHSAAVDLLRGEHLAERTRHALEAARLGASETDRAIDLCMAAGASAHRKLAFEGAARHFEDALALARGSNAAADIVVRATLGRAESLAAVGARSEAVAAFTWAADQAEELGDARLLARAAIGCAATREYVTRDEEKLRLLERAFAALGAEESELGVRLLIQLANDLRMRPDSRQRRGELTAQALGIARRLATDETVTLALEARLEAIYGADSVEERLATAQEILTLARARGDADREIVGLRWQLSALLERGDVVEAASLAELHARLAEARRVAGPRINARSRLAALAFLAGRFEEGFTLAAEAKELGCQAEDQGAEILYRAQLLVPCELLGKREELQASADCLQREGARMIHAVALQALLARALVFLGRAEQARALLTALSTRDFVDVPDDFSRVATLASLAETAVQLRESAALPALGRLLSPYVAQCGMVGTAVSLGAVARPLGLVMLAQGRHDEATALLKSACERNARMQALPWLAWSEYALGEALRRSGREAEADAPRVSALARARSLAMTPLLDLLTSSAPAPAPQAPVSTTATLRRDGAAWVLTCGERALTLGSRRGLDYIARLLASPGSEFHALEMTARGESAPHEGKGDDVLDARAKAEIRSRLQGLRRRLEVAEEQGDAARAASVRQELETLEDHLLAALGLGGRSRKQGSGAERARVAVTVAIRRAIADLEPQMPEIARHLSRSVRTGLFCSYDPDPSGLLRVTT